MSWVWTVKKSFLLQGLNSLSPYNKSFTVDTRFVPSWLMMQLPLLPPPLMATFQINTSRCFALQFHLHINGLTQEPMLNYRWHVAILITAWLWLLETNYADGFELVLFAYLCIAVSLPTAFPDTVLSNLWQTHILYTCIVFFPLFLNATSPDPCQGLVRSLKGRPGIAQICPLYQARLIIFPFYCSPSTMFWLSLMRCNAALCFNCAGSNGCK